MDEKIQNDSARRVFLMTIKRIWKHKLTICSTSEFHSQDNAKQ